MNWERIAKTLTKTATTELGGRAGMDYAGYAEDLAQDAVLALIEKDVTTEDDAFKLGTKMVADWAKNLRKGETRRREIEAVNGTTINRNLTGQSAEGLAADPLDLLVRDEMVGRFATLSPVLANTLQLVCEEGVTIPEAAERLGITPNAVYQRLWQIREITGADNND